MSSSDNKNPFSPDSRNRHQHQGSSSTTTSPHRSLHTPNHSSTNPFQTDEDEIHTPYSQNQFIVPQHPQPTATRSVTPSASHYNNYSMPSSTPHSSSAPYSPPTSSPYEDSSSNSPAIQHQDYQNPSSNSPQNSSSQGISFADAKAPYYSSSDPPSNDLSNSQNQNQNSFSDSLQPRPRPTSAQIYDNIAQQQRHISFAINEGEEINLSNPNVNFSSGPGFLSTPHTDPSQNSSNVSLSSDIDSNVMKRHRWGTQRHKKGRPKNEIKRNKSIFSTHSKKRVSSATSHHSSSSLPTNDNHNLSDDAPPVDSPEHGVHRIFFNTPLPDDMIDPELEAPIITYPRNKIRTAKYTPLSFLPKNLYFQFKNIANIYFLFIVILGAFTIFGVQNPGLASVPIIVIVAITAVKDAIEDYRRTLLDLEVNNTKTQILSYWHNVNVTDENVSAWRRFKKACSRVMFRTIKSVETAQEKRRIKKDPNYVPRHTEDLDLTTTQTIHSISSDHEMQDLSNRRSRTRRSVDTIHSINENPFEDSNATTSDPGSILNPQIKAPGTARFRHSYWKTVRVGDFIRIKNNDEIPADVLIISTSDSDGACYVETKNLDGETNLKVRQSLKCSQKVKHASDCEHAEFWVESETAHANLYSFNGVAKWYNRSSPEFQPDSSNYSPIRSEPISINNILLRGCSLRNTEWVIGVVLFTGPETKIMLNAGETPSKKSRISRELNWAVIYNFIILFIICLLSGLINGIEFGASNTSITFFEFGSIGGSPPVDGLVTFWAAVILYQSLVPISLYISIEIVKTIQAFFIYSDVFIYYAPIDYPCTPKSWNISDDLGQIEYVFSDKTGTLTQNVMEFKKCTINGVAYGKAYTEAMAGMRKRDGIDVEVEGREMKQAIANDKIEMVQHLQKLQDNDQMYEENLTFISSAFVDDLDGHSGPEQQDACKHFMLALALCHSVITEASKKFPGRIEFKAQSPDEAALVATARDVGFVFKDRTRSGVILNVQGKEIEYQILNTLEFNSTRKRMSAIVKFPGQGPNGTDKIVLICKGADSIIYSRLTPSGQERLSAETALHLEQFASEGLRTLCIAERVLDPEEYKQFNKDHDIASSALENREEKMEEVADALERNLTLLGGTAIEDRLQEGVPQTIALLGMAGIKLWVLTGDKVETAINIGFSANLLDNGMELIILRSDTLTVQAVDRMLTEYLEKYFNLSYSAQLVEEAKSDHSPPSPNFAIVVDGDTLKLCLDEELKYKFLILCKQCKSVLCCRVSPAQKAAVVSLVKNTLDVMTLSIGDGANDVAMIQEADVGVGIAGEEGRQAVMSSDYAVGQFRFLARLLLVHGRWSYKRLAEMIPNFFYKNVVFTFALFWYGAFSSFDGAYLFDYTYVMFFNLAFTSLPVILMGFLDQDVEDRISLAVPQLFRRGILRLEWSQFKFWVYMIDGFYQSLISFFFPFFIHLGGTFTSENGRALDHRFWLGVSVCTIAVVSCNFFVISNQYRWDIASLIVAGVSSWLVWVWSGIYSSFTASRELYKVADELYQSASFWAVILLGIVTAALPHYCIMSVQKLFFPLDVDIIREQITQGVFDMIPPITEEYDGLNAAAIFEKASQSAQLSREHGSGNGTNPQRFSANHVGTGKHVSSDEEGSEDLYPEKDMSSSSSGSTSHKRHMSLTKRLSLKKKSGSDKNNGNDYDEESLVSPNRDPKTNIGYSVTGPEGDSLYTSSSNALGNLSPVASSMTGHSGRPVPGTAEFATNNAALLRVPGSSSNNGNETFQYRRHDYPEEEGVDMRQIRQSLEIARSNIRNEQAPRKSLDAVRMSADLGDDLTTAEGLMRTYTRQKANEDEPEHDTPPLKKRETKLQKFFHKSHNN